MILVDVHSHLDHPSLYSQIDDIVSRAKASGVKAVITNGITPATNKVSLELSKKYDIVYSALGIYPPETLAEEAGESDYPKVESFDIDKEIAWIRKKIKENKKVLALGEVGLDHSSERSDKETQRKIFSKFIKLSEETGKPLIVHSRKAEEEVIEMLEASTLKNVLMHCFSGKFRLVRKISDRGWNFSVPGNVVRSQQFQLMVENTPLAQILTETDAPFLSPFKEKDNEPSFIIENIKKIAEIKKMTPEEVSNQIYMNFQRLFL